MTLQRMAALTRQWSTSVSIGFAVLALLITTKALAGMMGGSFVAYLVALGIVSALVILIGNVTLARFHQGDPTTERKGAPMTLPVQAHPLDAA